MPGGNPASKHFQKNIRHIQINPRNNEIQQPGNILSKRSDALGKAAGRTGRTLFPFLSPPQKTGSLQHKKNELICFILFSFSLPL